MVNALPLCVDLDGTLIQNDLVVESIHVFLKKYPWKFGALCVWFLKGFAYLKCEVAKQVTIDLPTLRYNNTLIQWLQSQNHPLYLVTGSPQKYANQIKDYLIPSLSFQEAYGATPGCRLTGESKAAFLKKRFSSFIYVGNSKADIPVWKAATEIVAVNITADVKEWIHQQDKPFKIF